MFMGAGSAGVGVAKQLVEYYTRRGLTEQEAKNKFWLVDTKGLVTKDRGDRLAEHKKYFARTDNNGHQFRTLEEVIEYVKPSALVGLAATFGVFDESIVRALKASVDAGGMGRRPILFPLSNPLTKAECTFEQAVNWTEGTVVFASGSPFASYTVKNGDQSVTYHPNQGNNGMFCSVPFTIVNTRSLANYTQTTYSLRFPRYRSRRHPGQGHQGHRRDDLHVGRCSGRLPQLRRGPQRPRIPPHRACA